MLAYQDPNHESYHKSRRPGRHHCLGCKKPVPYSAWGPWCHPCNVKRLDQISSFLEDFTAKAKFDAAVREAVSFNSALIEDLLNERNAILRAAGGKVTATKEQRRPASHWSHQSHEDGSETYQIDL